MSSEARLEVLFFPAFVGAPVRLNPPSSKILLPQEEQFVGSSASCSS